MSEATAQPTAPKPLPYEGSLASKVTIEISKEPEAFVAPAAAASKPAAKKNRRQSNFSMIVSTASLCSPMALSHRGFLVLQEFAQRHLAKRQFTNAC